MAAAAWADGVSVIDGGAAALAAAKERVNVAPVDHVESHGEATACGAYIDPDSVRVWPNGFVMNVRVPHWSGGLDIRLEQKKMFEIDQFWGAGMKSQTKNEIIFTTRHWPAGGRRRLDDDPGLGPAEDDTHDNEFGFMGAGTYEEGDIVVVEDEGCEAYHPQKPPPTPPPPFPPSPPPPPPPMPPPSPSPQPPPPPSPPLPPSPPHLPPPWANPMPPPPPPPSRTGKIIGLIALGIVGGSAAMLGIGALCLLQRGAGAKDGESKPKKKGRGKHKHTRIAAEADDDDILGDEEYDEEQGDEDEEGEGEEEEEAPEEVEQERPRVEDDDYEEPQIILGEEPTDVASMRAVNDFGDKPKRAPPKRDARDMNWDD